MLFLRSFLISIIVGVFAFNAHAEEAISRFDVVIQVSENGDYLVRETINVQVEGRRIKRGIFRDLPRYYMLDELRVPFRYDVKSVTRNGQKEPFETLKDGNAYQIRIGDADVFLPYGRQVYQIEYQVKDEIRRDDQVDFVYWNVTGNYWAFPIRSASVRVIMPPGAELRKREAFTGVMGAETDDTSFAKEGEHYVLKTTRELSRGEGMTVRLQFEKGVIAPTPDSTKRYIWWLRNGAMLILASSFLAMLVFFLRNWDRVGRDPAKPPVFPRYVPPKGYSAAGASYVHYNRLKGSKPLIATLLGLAHKRQIHIDAQEKKKTVIKRLNGAGESAELNAEEAYLLKILFPKSRSETITLKSGKPHARFYAAQTKFQSHLAQNFSSKYFKWNGKYMFLGLFLSVIALVAAFSQKAVGSFPGFGFVVAAMIGMNILFFFLLPAPTKYGQKMRAEIEGFRLFMKTAEEGRFDAVDVGSEAPPPMSLDRYEALLPYAVALDVEDPWSKYFEKLMPDDAANYNPTWSTFSSGNHGSVSNLTDSMVSNMSSGVSSAAPPSSSGSGSSGGSSGGGGGGGGGGGW